MKYVSAQRIEAISNELRNRIDRLSDIVVKHTPAKQISLTDDEPDEDEAESYGMKME